METIICHSKTELGQKAATRGAELIRDALSQRGAARIIVATGASQFETLSALVEAPDVDWNRVTVFHLDEYVGMTAQHPASFRRYLRERFVERLPQPLTQFHPVNGEGDAQQECARLSALIAQAPVDVCFAGIGENAHLAFNDPPADFETREPYLVVELDEACRRQQQGEGWFATLDEVPTRAISMSIHQIMDARAIVCSVPDQRKAAAVKACVQGPVSPNAPASVLQNHPDATLYLDPASASLLG